MIEAWVDGDMIAYEALLAVVEDIDWGDGIISTHVDINLALARFREILDDATSKIEEQMDRTVINYFLCFTSLESNFRKEIDPNYKSNRKGKKKPTGFSFLIDKLRKHYTVIMRKGLEADDCIGIGVTRPFPPNNPFVTRVIISGDKDMNTLPCAFYDYIHEELTFNNKESSTLYFLTQILTGDKADGYSGCPKYGKVRATKALKNNPTWKRIVECYEEQGLTEEDALRNARLAYILQNADYNQYTKEITLWNPKMLSGNENLSQKKS